MTPDRPGVVTVVCIHGLGGSPASLGVLPAALQRAGFAVSLPTLPGHDTDVDDLAGTDGADWLAAVDHVTAAAPGPVVLVGQSLGGVLALLVAAGPHRDRVIGVATMNAPVQPADPDVLEHFAWLISRGTTTQPAGEPDLADPEACDRAYDQIPVRSLSDLVTLSAAAHDAVPSVTVPVLVVTSLDDGVVDPALGDQIAVRLGGSAERLVLPNSRHVACLDLDRDLLVDQVRSFVERVGGLSA